MFVVGVDSLMAIKLARELEDILHCVLAVDALLEADTFIDLVHPAQKALGGSSVAGISGCEDDTISSATEDASDSLGPHSESVTTAMIVRSGQIVKSTETGYWNSSEHFLATVKSSQSLGVFPALTGRLGWTLVYAAARIIVNSLLDDDAPETIYQVDNPRGQD
ncbi:hypothetical protein BJX70DRAFT_403938 [Aspergillus crustosus]